MNRHVKQTCKTLPSHNFRAVKILNKSLTRNGFQNMQKEMFLLVSYFLTELLDLLRASSGVFFKLGAHDWILGFVKIYRLFYGMDTL